MDKCGGFWRINLTEKAENDLHSRIVDIDITQDDGGRNAQGIPVMDDALHMWF